MLYLGSVSDIVTQEDLAKERKVGSNQPWLERSIDPALIDMLKTPWPSLKKLWLHDMDKEEYKEIMKCFKNGSQKGLLQFGVSMWRHADQQIRQYCMAKATRNGRNYRLMQDSSSVETLPSFCLPSVVNLTLNRFIFSIEHLSVLENTFIQNLRRLDVSSSHGMTGRWSLLLSQTFPLLQSLILSDCGLNAHDLVSLAKANVERKLPNLERLDLSKNCLLKDNIESLFALNCQWNDLKYFDFEEELSLGFKNLQVLMKKIEAGNLSALQTFKFATDSAEILTKSSSLRLNNLKEIEVCSSVDNFVDVSADITSAVENDVYLALCKVDVNILSQKPDSGTDKTIATELASLAEELRRVNLPEQNINHVILSFRNSMINLQERVHVESMKISSDRISSREMVLTDETIDAMSVSTTESVVKSLSSENWTRHHFTILRSCLHKFYVKLFKILCGSNPSVLLLRDILPLLPSIEYRLAKRNISLRLFRMSKFLYRYVF